MTSVEQQFTEFATLAAPRLRRTAFLLCGDWHTAEDLAQTALAKVFVSWRRISRKDAAQAYATRTLVNSYLADRRRKRASEVLFAGCPRGARHRSRHRNFGSWCSTPWPRSRAGPGPWWCCATGRT